MEGIVVVNKTKGITSRDVVNKLNHIFSMKRIGHTGTLDPLATGVLVVALGKYTKLVNSLTSLEKEYVAEITLGIKTDTGDITGKVIKKMEYDLNEDKINECFASFVGSYNQTVPIYSAVKVNGKRLYQYARENEDVKLPVRKVEIIKIELISFKDNKIVFKVLVSKGTYIRALIEDICEKLNTVGTMSNLKRTKQGNFSIQDAYTLDEIEHNNYKLLNICDIFNYPRLELDDETYKKVINGVRLTNNKKITGKVILTYKKNPVAIYKVEQDFLGLDFLL